MALLRLRMKTKHKRSCFWKPERQPSHLGLVAGIQALPPPQAAAVPEGCGAAAPRDAVRAVPRPPYHRPPALRVPVPARHRRALAPLPPRGQAAGAEHAGSCSAGTGGGWERQRLRRGTGQAAAAGPGPGPGPEGARGGRQKRAEGDEAPAAPPEEAGLWWAVCVLGGRAGLCCCRETGRGG